MSNAMRSGKRALAGVAAGALAAGMISFVGAGSASAAGNIAGTTSPVRPGAYGAIPAATVSFAGASSSLSDDDTMVGFLITAPAAGSLVFDDSTGLGGTADDSISLARNNRVVVSDTLGNGAGFFGVNSDDDSTIAITVDTAGQYVGGLGNGTDTVTFNFTTVGNPASMTLTPASQTVLVGETAELEVTLKDASGNITQPSTVDTIGLSDNTDDTIVADPADTSAITSVPSADMSDGVGTIYLQTFGHSAGTTTVTATPQGTLVSLGLTAQTATVTKSGSVTSTSIKSMSVTTPANAINAGTAPVTTAQVPSPTTSVTVTIDDTTVATAGNQIRLAATVGAGGSVNGVEDDTAYVLVTTDANKQATATFALGGTAAINGGVLTVTQVNVLGAATSPAAKLTVSVKTPAVNPADVVPTPAGVITAVVGATTPVTVQVDDSFGTPIPGWIVNAHRGSASGTVVGTGTTDSSGSASLSVKPLSTTVAGQNETYYFVATNPVLPSQSTEAAKTLKVNYETNADVTAISVAPNAAAASTFSAASPTQATLPVVLTPSGGTIGDPTAPSSGIYTVSSAKVTTAPTNNVLSFTVTTTPTNAVTVTAPEGVKVSATAPTNGVTLWSAGSQTATITGDGSAKVYVWGTKTGIHELTFASTGLEVKGKIVVANKPSDAYNIDLSPAKQDVTAGGISTVTLSVTDVFGNGVATGTSDDSGPVTITASGEVLLAGYATSDTFTTDTAGKATVTVIAGNSAGAGLLTATPKTGTTTPAWVSGYTPPTGAPAPVTSATAEVTVTTKPTTKTIVITGERGTVKGRPGIMVDGITTGFAEGDLVKPWIKFPGQTSYSEGSARPAIDAEGEFYWQRKTGKKIYVYFTNENGDVKSDRIIIQAK